MKEEVEEQIQTVFDPEFPLIDIRTMGLIYNVEADEETQQVSITMTYTTPACPSGDLMQEMMETAIHDVYPDAMVLIEVVFDPMRTIDMMKDEDLKRMFE
jgi:metal-sulfur cluster biosynthetic enzyme